MRSRDGRSPRNVKKLLWIWFASFTNSQCAMMAEYVVHEVMGRGSGDSGASRS